MPKHLSDQVVVITGASQGIGRETALRFAAAGASVVVAARNDEALRALTTEIVRLGGRAEGVVADVADHHQVERIGAVALDRFGRVDTWVNNAGVSIYGTVEQVDAEEMERLVQVNLLGLMYGSKVAVALMKPRGGGT